MTEQEKIEQAAKDHARQWHKDNPDEYKNPDASPRVDFLAGNSFYAKEVMPEKMAEFAQWVGGRYEKWGTHWIDIHNNTCTTEELVIKFLEQSKQKDNEHAKKS